MQDTAPPTDGSGPPHVAGDGIEEDLARLAAEVSAEADSLQELADLERLLWERLHETRDRSSAAQRAPHPLVAVARSWRAELGVAAEGTGGQAGELALCAQRVGAQVDGLFECETRSWRDRWSEAAGASQSFEALLEASRLEHGMLRAGVGGEAPGLLAEGRGTARRDLRSALDERPATADERERWTDHLVDMADEVRSAQLDVADGPAVVHLDLAASDLAWHLAAVEREGGENERRLRRKHRRLIAEKVERQLAQRLVQKFGERCMVWWDRAILLAILLVLGLLFVPFFTELTPRQLETLAWIDTAACAFFLWDFFYKAVLVRFQRGWLLRHTITDFLPSLPFGLLHAGFILRLGRGWRLLRGLRLLLPVIRVARAIGFLAHGADRMVRRYGHLLDHDVILHPNRLERARDRHARSHGRPGAWRAIGKVSDIWEDLLAHAQPAERLAVAQAREGVLQRVVLMGWSRSEGGGDVRPMRQGPCAETLLERLGTVPAEEVEGELGPDFVASAGRAVRAIARSPLRWMPLFHAYVPRITRDASDAEATASLVRRASTRLLRHYRRSQWVADLYGTVTPSGLVGGVGTALVRRTARPAGRLLVLALLFGLVKLTMTLFGITELSSLADHIASLVGSALVVLGSLCLVLLGLGFWMQRLANDSSTFYDQVATAQFAHLTECVRVRTTARDIELLDKRVLRPERILFERDEEAAGDEERATMAACVESWLSAGRPGRTPRPGFDPVARAVLLYRDSLDGSLLTEADTRTTVQLLGNLALQRGRERSMRFTRRDEKRLGRLDLERRRVLLKGPYLWFHFIAKSVTQGAARLVVDYNQHALPLDEVGAAAPRTRERYRGWLSRRRANPELLPDSTPDLEALEEKADGGSVELTTAFSTLHFLDRSPERDDEVERRFGRAVRKIVERDRRALFRRVFGSYPLHLRPPEDRVLNLRTVYHRWIEGGRVVWMPFRLFGLAFSLTWQALCFIGRCVREIQNPGLGPAGMDAAEAEADFVSASRKIDRMRAPSALECLRQRAMFDAEYLGVPLPGRRRAGGAGVLVDDLDFLNAPPPLRAEVEAERVRAVTDLRRLSVLIEGGLLKRAQAQVTSGARSTRVRGLTREHMRALVAAYRLDDRSLRSLLSWHEILNEVCDAAIQSGEGPKLVRPRPLLWLTFRRYWAEYREDGWRARRCAWRAVRRDQAGAALALARWGRHGAAEASRKGEARLAELLRHPGRVSEELVTLRAVQTLALIDVRNYRSHVWDVGEYGEAGGDPDARLRIEAGDLSYDPSTEPGLDPAVDPPADAVTEAATRT